jgi:hypothetical protein
MKRVCLTALAWLCLTAGLSAQIMNGSDVPEEPAKPVSPGDLSPYFWIGAQTIAVVGKNLQTGASGIAYNGNQTWVSFDVSFLDSHWDTPKKIVSTDDPNVWTVGFKLIDPTARINSYSSSPETNYPSWSLGVQGFGWSFGTFFENNQPQGVNTGGDTSNVPASGATLNGANEVLYLGAVSALDQQYLEGYDYLADNLDSVVQISYPVTGAAYAAYQAGDWYRVAATVGTGNATGDQTKAFAGVLNFSLSPMGPGSYDEPLTYTIKGDVIAGKGFTAAGNAQGNPFGFGLQGQVDYYWDDDMAVSPILAFDGRVNDTTTPGVTLNANAYRFDWKAGAGVMVTLSPKRWVTDLYEELPQTQSTFENVENAHIRKFTYLQLMADYSRSSFSDTARDLNVVFKGEEPDGVVGLDDNLGAMVEMRVGNVLRTNPGSKTTWASIGRASYDLVQHTVTPYIQAYYDSSALAKLRFGAQMELVKGTAIEVTYMTANLTGVSSRAQDAGRLEVIFGMATDPTFRLIKTMNFSYEGTEQ